jgi:C4-dicarboxylate transporter DctQ subunit
LVLHFRKTARLILKFQDQVTLWGSRGAALALGLIVVIYSYEVTMRYLLAAPTNWASDFVAFLLLISVFLFLPALTKDGGNVAVTLIPDLMSAKASGIMMKGGFLVASVVCLWAAYIGVLETDRLIQRNTMTLTTVRLPKWVFLAVITYGLANSGLYFIRLALASGPDRTAIDNA